MADLAQVVPSGNHRFSSRCDTVLVYSLDYDTLQVIREFLEPLGFAVEFAPLPGPNPYTL
jgi:hypothetical protein